MNAYELADKVDLEPYGIYGEQAANMLRQQADRITELEKVIFDRNVDLAKTINRITELENQLDKCSHHEAMAHQGGYELGKASQIKELSDEEILQFRDKVPYSLGSDLIDFARAILKKANEK